MVTRKYLLCIGAMYLINYIQLTSTLQSMYISCFMGLVLSSVLVVSLVWSVSMLRIVSTVQIVSIVRLVYIVSIIWFVSIVLVAVSCVHMSRLVSRVVAIVSRILVVSCMLVVSTCILVVSIASLRSVVGRPMLERILGPCQGQDTTDNEKLHN